MGLTCSSLNSCRPAHATDFPDPCFIVGRYCVYTLFNPLYLPRIHHLQCRHYICWMNCFNYEHQLHPSGNLDPGIIFDSSLFINHWVLWFYLFKCFWICLLLFLFWLPTPGLKWIGSDYLFPTPTSPISNSVNSSHPGHPVANFTHTLFHWVMSHFLEWELVTVHHLLY